MAIQITFVFQYGRLCTNKLTSIDRAGQHRGLEDHNAEEQADNTKGVIPRANRTTIIIRSSVMFFIASITNKLFQLKLVVSKNYATKYY